MSDALCWFEIAAISGRNQEEFDKNAANLRRIHTQAATYLADGWRVQANQIYTTGDGMAWFYLWMVKCAEAR